MRHDGQVKGRPILVLLVVVLLAAIGIGFSLTRQRPLTAEKAQRECARQDPRASVQEQGACIRSKQQPRAVPTTALVVLLPIAIGAVGVAVLALSGASARPPRCARCGADGAPGDAVCVECGAPVVSTAPERPDRVG